MRKLLYLGGPFIATTIFAPSFGANIEYQKPFSVINNQQQGRWEPSNYTYPIKGGVNTIGIQGTEQFPKGEELKEIQTTIEYLFNSRLKKAFPNIRENLTLFGYNFFTYKSIPQNLGLPVPEDYTLGPGDELFLYFT